MRRNSISKPDEEDLDQYYQELNQQAEDEDEMPQNEESALKKIGDVIKLPLDLSDDVIVALKDFITVSEAALQYIVGGVFGVLCFYQAGIILSELIPDMIEEMYDDETDVSANTIIARNIRRKRIAKNIPSATLALGGAGLGLGMICGAAGLAVLGAAFFPLAIMTALTVNSGFNLIHTVSEYYAVKAQPPSAKRDAQLSHLKTKMVYDSIDFTASAVITTAIAFAAFSLFASVSVLGMGIPLLIIIAAATIGCIAKIHEHRHSIFSCLSRKNRKDRAQSPGAKSTTAIKSDKSFRTKEDKKNETLSTKTSAISQKIQKIEEKIKSNREKIIEIDKLLNEKRNELSAKESEERKLLESMVKLQTSKSNQRLELEHIDSNIVTLESSLKKAEEQRTSLKGKLLEAEAEVTRLLSQPDENKGQEFFSVLLLPTKIRLELINCQDEINSFADQLSECGKNKAIIMKNLPQLDVDLKNQGIEYDEVRSKIQEIRASLQSQIQEKNQLENMLDSLGKEAESLKHDHTLTHSHSGLFSHVTPDAITHQSKPKKGNDDSDSEGREPDIHT